jgi:hypothetical protein
MRRRSRPNAARPTGSNFNQAILLGSVTFVLRQAGRRVRVFSWAHRDHRPCSPAAHEKSSRKSHRPCTNSGTGALSSR